MRVFMGLRLVLSCFIQCLGLKFVDLDGAGMGFVELMNKILCAASMQFVLPARCKAAV